MSKHAKINAGVYQLRNVVTGERYIGSSENLRQRIASHVAGIRSGKHPMGPHFNVAFPSESVVRVTILQRNVLYRLLSLLNGDATPQLRRDLLEICRFVNRDMEREWIQRRNPSVNRNGWGEGACRLTDRQRQMFNVIARRFGAADDAGAAA